MHEIDQEVMRLVDASWDEREAAKAALLALALAHSDRAAVCTRLEEVKRTIDSLEVRWELDEVIEALQPEPEPEPEPEEAEEEGAQDDAESDFVLVYDDPRGLLLHKSRTGDRWLLTQPDPYTGQPATVPISPEQLSQVKAQLRGSPYWVLGAESS